MAATEISVKKYVMRMSADEREQLEALIRKGKSPAQRLLKARILLKADVSEAGEGWRAAGSSRHARFCPHDSPHRHARDSKTQESSSRSK
jgi:hypothetical protein